MHGHVTVQASFQPGSTLGNFWKRSIISILAGLGHVAVASFLPGSIHLHHGNSIYILVGLGHVTIQASFLPGSICTVKTLGKDLSTSLLGLDM